MNYTPEKLVAISRYRNYFPTLSSKIQSDTYARMKELLKEEKEYCDKGNRKHMVSEPKRCARAESAVISDLSAMKRMPGTAGSAAGAFKEYRKWDCLKTL